MALIDTIPNALSLMASALTASLRPGRDSDRGERLDQWANDTTGIGTSRDKSAGGYFAAPDMLTDQELTDLFNHDALSFKIVYVPVREAFKNGWTACVKDDVKANGMLDDFLKPFNLLQLTKQAATWGDLYGGCVLWLRTDETDPSKPWPEPKKKIGPPEKAYDMPEPKPAAPAQGPPVPGAPKPSSPPVPGVPPADPSKPPAEPPEGAPEPPTEEPEPFDDDPLSMPEDDPELEPDEPPPEPASAQDAALPEVIAIEVIDRRFLSPFRYYTKGPKAGQPETYQVFVTKGGGVTVLVGEIHESRLVKFGGAPTEHREKQRRLGWDQSALQRVYESLQAAGGVWKSIEILTADANQAVYKIKNFWRMVLSDPTTTAGDATSGTLPGGALLKRIQLMDLFRSVTRALVLDQEDEEFERQTTSFAGLPELSERQWTRVSAAADIPMPLLTGEYPSGLQSNGEGPFRVFNSSLRARQTQDYSPAVLALVKLLLRTPNAPRLSEEQWCSLEIKWPTLWEPTAAELAEIRLKRAQEANTLIQAQILHPEEAAATIAEEGGWDIDQDMRDDALDAMTSTPAQNALAKDQANRDAQVKAAAAAAGKKPGEQPPGKPGAGGPPFGAPAGKPPAPGAPDA